MKEKTTIPGLSADEVKLSIDEKDLAILKMLQENARFTVREIAAAVHLSTTPVHERIKRLEESGVITQYAALVDPAKVGKELMVICYVSLKEHSKKSGAKFVKFVQEMDQIVACYSISGDYDFMLKVVAKNMNEYYDFHVNTLSQVENIGHLQSVFVMGKIKETHRLV
jgi:Lrp/AsnC family leucine-responsive transcriptional regulator